jgi:hypothetical protein
MVAILLREAGHQHQPADVVQQPGREGVILVEAHLPCQHFGAGGGGDRVAPERLVVEAGAMAFGKAAGDGRRRDQVARGLEAEEGNRLLDGGDLDLQAIQRGIGQRRVLAVSAWSCETFLASTEISTSSWSMLLSSSITTAGSEGRSSSVRTTSS